MEAPRLGPNMNSEQSLRLGTLERLLAIRSTTVHAALTEASNVLAVTFRADKIDTFLYDESKDTLVAVGTSQTPLGELQHKLGLDHMPVANGGRAVEVFQTGQPYLSGRVDEDLRELRGIREALGVRSEIAVLLEVDGIRRGVVSVNSAQPDHYSEGDLHFLQTVAQWISLILQRSELVERVTREATEDARRLVAEELITILAHDLGNYLTPLIGRLYILRTRAEREGRAIEVQEADLLGKGLQRMQRLINDLLDVGRIEGGLFSVVPQPVNVAQLARELALALQTPQFVVEIRAADEVIAVVDPDRIQQALENLLTNAQRHAPGSEVVLSVQSRERPDGHWAVLTVEDRGPGIPPEVLPRLMERFVRGQQSRGIGIGLYLTRRIAEAHGGSLTVESTIGVGTTFQLSLPLIGLDHLSPAIR